MKKCNVEQDSVKGAEPTGPSQAAEGGSIAVTADFSPGATVDNSRAARDVRRYARVRALLHAPPLPPRRFRRRMR